MQQQVLMTGKSFNVNGSEESKADLNCLAKVTVRKYFFIFLLFYEVYKKIVLDYKGMFTYDVSQKWGFADPPSPSYQPISEIGLPPFPSEKI